MKKVLIIDTSILCVFLEVPNMNECGKDGDKWSLQRVNDKIQEELRRGECIFVLPMATLIETGNHIAQASKLRFETAERLSAVLEKVANQEEPWAAFSAQDVLWDRQHLLTLAEEWPKLASSKISIGDATIKNVAEYYADAGYEVEILTGDSGLKAYQPQKNMVIPRRRKI